MALTNRLCSTILVILFLLTVFTDHAIGMCGSQCTSATNYDDHQRAPPPVKWTIKTALNTFKVCTMEVGAGETTAKHNIPLNHLDYSYIKKCSNIKELEKILKVLKSGDEGCYPEMETLTEERIKSIDPNSRLLRKDSPIVSSKDLDKQERETLIEDLQQWQNEMRSKDNEVPQGAQSGLPPVRGSASISVSKNSTNEPKKADKTVKPRDYREWDKLDIDAELAKVDESKTKSSEPSSKASFSRPDMEREVDASKWSVQEKLRKAEREKDKGNEAFRSGDYEEALLYYQRSISIIPSVAATNNRAQIYLKMKRWLSAIDDCNSVLKMDASNIKALLRRATAYQGQKEFVKAQTDVRKVLEKEPGNKRAQTLMTEIEKALAEQKVKGRRMVIEEVEGSDDEEEESEMIREKNEENLLRNGDSVQQDEKFVNGHAKKTTEGQTKVTGSQPKVIEVTDGQPEVTKVTESQPEVVECPQVEEKCMPAKELAKEAEKPLESKASPLTPSPLSPEVNHLKDKGNTLFRNGQYSDALQIYNQAIDKLMPELNTQASNLSVLYSNRAACKNKLGDCSGCVEDCTKALNLTPGAAKPLLRRAMAHEALEKYRLAYVDYRQVLSVDPNVDTAQQGSTRLTRVLREQDGNKWREKLPPMPCVHPGGLSFPASILSASQVAERKAKEREENEKKRKHEAEMKATFNEKKTAGNALVQKGQYQKAVECYSVCVECCPENPVAFSNRALCYLRLNQPDMVIDDCNKALSLDFGNVKALFRRAQAYRMMGKHEECAIDLQTLLKIDPSNAAAKKELSLVEKDKLEKKLLHEREITQRLAEEQQQRQRMHIQEVEGSSSDEEDSRKQKPSKPTCTRNAAPCQKAPTLQKCTPYEFLHAWASLKCCQTAEPYLSLILQLTPKEFPKVLSNKLEGDMMLNIVRSMEALYKRGDERLVFEYLNNLCLVPRFQMVTMFMSDAEKTILCTIFKDLAKKSDALGLSLTDVLKTQRSYGI
ncbi:hypothetical protein CAPTEDRAFT_219848 [Capitella teleta]|uniref:RNA-polymerase II-associated protein 3-like C-terminal domain-containing protein n=1 Tax=Capitella teleta TaxID=283909 RepID=R7VIY7_CAPTE|nr:hypothetical protein CAPTEDRAFT_219848 [Capitella teleta]|eukprot:ELU18522.1 hypothetical protein CAPTEDRAFT_219848 [Capitella teleta]